MLGESSVQTAEREVLESIDGALGLAEENLSVPMSKINEAVSAVVTSNAKAIKRLTEKILKAADKNSVAASNQLDAVYSNLLGGIDSWLGNARFLLTQLAAKGGLAEIGQPLETALEQSATNAAGIEYMGTLVLAVKEAIPWFDRIALALERIADKINPLELDSVNGKQELVEVSPKIIDGTDDLEPFVPIDWPQV